MFVNLFRICDSGCSAYARRRGVIKKRSAFFASIPVSIDLSAFCGSRDILLWQNDRGIGKMNTLKSWVFQFVHDEDGQGITEYFACLAFLALLIATIFAFENGTFFTGLGTAFSNMAAEINKLVAGSNTPTI